MAIRSSYVDIGAIQRKIDGTTPTTGRTTYVDIGAIQLQESGAAPAVEKIQIQIVMP